ncbi:MAG: hypothetical protein ACD_75C02442G0001, partial [uncultured bacterium]
MHFGKQLRTVQLLPVLLFVLNGLGFAIDGDGDGGSAHPDGMNRHADVLDLAGDRCMQRHAESFRHFPDQASLADIRPLGNRRGTRSADMLAEDKFKLVRHRHGFYRQTLGLGLTFGRMNPALGKRQQRFHNSLKIGIRKKDGW